MHKTLRELPRAMVALERVESLFLEHGIRARGHQACGTDMHSIEVVVADQAALVVEWGVLALEWMIMMDFSPEGGTTVVVALSFEPTDEKADAAQISLQMESSSGSWLLETDGLLSCPEARELAETLPCGDVPEEKAEEIIRMFANHFASRTRRTHCDA